MWLPIETDETRIDEPDEDDTPDKSALWLILWFLMLMVLLGFAGWVVSQIGTQLVDRLGLPASIVGALVTAVITSLPELVTTIAAVRQGARHLAVGGIIGGNTFDTLFLTISDVGYRSGSIYHAVNSQDLFWLATGMLMTAVLMLGLIFREKQSPGRIGRESLALRAFMASQLRFRRFRKRATRKENFSRRRPIRPWEGLPMSWQQMPQNTSPFRSRNKTYNLPVAGNHRVWQGALHLSWTESGGSPVAPPATRGFSSMVPVGMVEAGLGARVTADYDAKGFYWSAAAISSQHIDICTNCDE